MKKLFCLSLFFLGIMLSSVNYGSVNQESPVSSPLKKQKTGEMFFVTPIKTGSSIEQHESPDIQGNTEHPFFQESENVGSELDSGCSQLESSKLYFEEEFSNHLKEDEAMLPDKKFTYSHLQKNFTCLNNRPTDALESMAIFLEYDFKYMRNDFDRKYDEMFSTLESRLFPMTTFNFNRKSNLVTIEMSDEYDVNPSLTLSADGYFKIIKKWHESLNATEKPTLVLRLNDGVVGLSDESINEEIKPKCLDDSDLAAHLDYSKKAETSKKKLPILPSPSFYAGSNFFKKDKKQF